MKKYLLLMVLFNPVTSYSDVLETPNYTVHVDINCDSEMLCDDVSYYGKSKVSGRELRLTGRTVHTICKDGVTPCTFLGYSFKNGKTEYFVTIFGELRVTDALGVRVLEESGEWVD